MAIVVNADEISDSWMDAPAKADVCSRLQSDGDPEAIREAVVYAPDIEDPTTWAGLHHEFNDAGELVVNRSAVYQAVGVISPSTGPYEAGVSWPTMAKADALTHLRGHMKRMNDIELAAMPSDDAVAAAQAAQAKMPMMAG